MESVPLFYYYMDVTCPVTSVLFDGISVLTGAIGLRDKKQNAKKIDLTPALLT